MHSQQERVSKNLPNRIQCEANIGCDNPAMWLVSYRKSYIDGIVRPSHLRNGVKMCQKHAVGVLDNFEWTGKAIQSIVRLEADN